MGAAGVPDRPAGTPAAREHTTGRPTAPQHAAGTAAGPAAATRILVAEDEPGMLRALRINLDVRGYRTAAARTGRAALAEARQRPPDAVILDLGLPDLDGVQVIRELRDWSRAPLIVLSGRAGPSDKITALDAGADDYVTKPFSMGELLARLRAALRRDDGTGAPARVTIGSCEIDLTAHTVLSGGTPVRLTPTEWRLLEILLRRPGQLVPGRQLLTGVWGSVSGQHGQYLRFHMAGLRRKLEPDPARPRHLLNEPGMGYRYQP